MRTTYSFAVAACLTCLGCSQSASNGSGNSYGNGTPQSGGSLQGTWDVVASRLTLENQMSFVVTLQPSSFAVVTPDGSLNAIITGDSATVDIIEGSRSRQVAATLGGRGQVNLGAMPVDISGSWMLAGTPSNGSSCSWSLGAGTVSGSCIDANFGLRWTPGPGTGTMTGSRTRVAQSIFGDLGGEWTVTFSGGASMTAIFEGNTMTLSGRKGLGAVVVSSLSLTFNGNTASGTGSDSVEVSAQRR